MDTEISYNDENIFNDYLKSRQDENSPHNMEVKQNIIKLIGNVKDKKILDLGCGVGDFSYYYSQNGAKRILGIDMSDRVIKYAEEHNKNELIEYRILNIYNIGELNEKFDVVISDIVFNYIISDFELLMKNIYNLLNKNGIVVFSQIHPFSTAPIGGREYTETKDGNMYYHLSNYGENGLRKTNYFNGTLNMYHRTFSNIINTAIHSGFEIEEIIEPIPSDKEIEMFPDRLKNIHKPSFLIVKLLKK